MLNFPVSIYIHGAGTSEGALGQGKPTDTYQSMSGSGQGTVSKVNNPKRYQLGCFCPTGNIWQHGAIVMAVTPGELEDNLIQ